MAGAFLIGGERSWRRNSTLPGIGGRRGKSFNEAGADRRRDDLLACCRAWPADWSKTTPVDSLAPGREAPLRLRVVTQPSLSYPRRGLLAGARPGARTKRADAPCSGSTSPTSGGRHGAGRNTCSTGASARGADLSSSTPPAGRRPASCRLVPVYPAGCARPGCWATSCDGCSRAARNRPRRSRFGWPGLTGLMGIARAIKNVHFPEDGTP